MICFFLFLEAGGRRDELIKFIPLTYSGNNASDPKDVCANPPPWPPWEPKSGAGRITLSPRSPRAKDGTPSPVHGAAASPCS